MSSVTFTQSRVGTKTVISISINLNKFKDVWRPKKKACCVLSESTELAAAGGAWQPHGPEIYLQGRDATLRGINLTR